MVRGHSQAVALVLIAVAVCGAGCGEETTESITAGNLIKENPNNGATRVTVGSKNFTEQYVLGEIYAQALEAAGYEVQTQLDLGSERVALEALRSGEVDAYPEYTSTALTSFFDQPPQRIPSDAAEAYAESRRDFERLGLVAYPPTPFSSANAVGLLTTRADELDVSKISDLEEISENLSLYGSPECRQRIDCLAGLERYYKLDFKSFTPVEIRARYEVLVGGPAELSILFTTDPQLFASDEFVVLDDDKEVFPAGNVLFIARESVAEEAGPDFAATVESVQENLTLEVVQELNARVDLDGETARRAARQYLEEFGYVR